MMPKILILGAGGQIGTELTEALNKKLGAENIIISDIKDPEALSHLPNAYVKVDVTQKDQILEAVQKYGIDQIYHMAAMLSATAEKYPSKGWEINMGSLMNVLEIARDEKLQRIFWPSSIAVFGHTTPKENTPQHTVVEPNTVYGISKYAGELWCQYFCEKFGVDVRSIRYPGIISWKTAPGGGTTDYAVEIYHEAIEKGEYTCFLSADRSLPMMYMPDAIKATLEIMEADLESLSTKMSYNIASMSFDPAQLADAIKKEIPDFKIHYNPDYRDEIASAWPASIDDSLARTDWAWKPDYDLDQMTQDMIFNLQTSNVGKETE